MNGGVLKSWTLRRSRGGHAKEDEIERDFDEQLNWRRNDSKKTSMVRIEAPYNGTVKLLAREQ